MGNRILGFDPSLTCTGAALMEDGKLLEWWRIRPKGKGDAVERAMEIADRLVAIIDDYGPQYGDGSRAGNTRYVVIETPAFKQHGKISGRAQGLASYGLAVGIIYGKIATIFDQHPFTKVSHVGADVWTKGCGSKDERKERAALAFPFYNRKKDSGGDVADAIWIAEWWRMTELWNQEEVGG